MAQVHHSERLSQSERRFKFTVGHFSPVPPGDRRYNRSYRRQLEPLEAQLVEVSGICKQFRDHPERRDLQSLLLIDLRIRPISGGKSIHLSHLWVLSKHIKRTGLDPKAGRPLRFIGSVYAYLRLGGKSKQRGLHGSHDFSILPMEASDIETFEPGISHRYDNETADSRTTGRAQSTGDQVGEREAGRQKHNHRRRRNNRSST